MSAALGTPLALGGQTVVSVSSGGLGDLGHREGATG